MEDLEIIKLVFDDNLKKIDQLATLGSDLIELFVGTMQSLQTQFKSLPLVKQKLENNILTFKNIDTNGSLKDKFEIIYNQSLILIVANFESFLNDVFKTIVNNYPHLLDFLEGKENKIGVDISFLKYSNATIGDLIVRAYKDKFNFQDLQSTLRFFQEMLDIDLEETLLDAQKEDIIYFQALRHVLVHNSSKIDPKFVSQVRDTHYAKKHTVHEVISLNKQDYDQAKEVFNEFATLIIRELEKKYKYEI